MEYQTPAMPQPPQPPRRARSFFRAFLLFGLAALGLAGLAGALGSLLPESVASGKGGKIALVEVTGIITDAEDTVRQLTDYRDDKNIKGIVLRIDSPGGVVAPAQEIYNEILKIRRAGKKIYASMGSLAASGGYYIAAPADLIVANAGTLTGSIGVIMELANTEKLLDKIGVKPDAIKSGPFKDTGSFFRAMAPEERRVMQSVIDDVFDQFVGAVAEGRKLDRAAVRKLADGRIYTGKQAFELRLVDKLGSLEDTIDLLAKEVGIKGKPKVVRERPRRNLWNWITEDNSTSPRQFLQKILSAPGTPSLQYLWTLR